MKTIETTALELRSVIDRLGMVKNAIADLIEEENELKDQLIDAGVTAAEGNLYRVSVSCSEGRNTTNWKSIATKLGASRQIIAANTSTGEPFYTIRVSARNGDL